MATIILEIAGLAYALDHGILWSKLTKWLEVRLRFLVFDGQYNARSANIVRIVQEDVRPQSNESVAITTYQPYWFLLNVARLLWCIRMARLF